jgi:hypothetical protein
MPDGYISSCPEKNKIIEKALSAYRNEMRACARAAPFVMSEREVLIAIMASYWARNKTQEAHRGHGRQVVPIHPGIDKVAKSAKVSRRTCQRALAMLRAVGVVQVVEYPGGGRYAERWVVNFSNLIAFRDCPKSDAAGIRARCRGQLRGANCHPKGCQKGANLSPGINIVIREEPIHGNVVLFEGQRIASKGGAV